MKIIAIITAKILILGGKILKRGSSLPGKIALKIDKQILYKLKYPQYRLVVTGSSGKGGTSSLIAEVLKKNGKTVCHNNSGSNLAWGITTSLIECSTIFGRLKTDYLVLEIDERYSKEVFPALKPTHLLVTNLTKDQPPRQHTIDDVYKDIIKNIPENTAIITTIDEPFLRKFSLDLPNKNIYYSLSKNKYSYKTQIFENLNTYFCPKCNTKLEYTYYNFETLGNYKCPKCGLALSTPEVTGTDLNLEKETLKINDQEVFIGGDMLYYAYNTLGAYTMLKIIGEKDIIRSINELNKPNPKYFKKKNKTYYGISCKAENATTYNEAVFKVLETKEPMDIIIGWKEISRRYNHFDLSWLYDITFELLNTKYVHKIYCCGIDKYNIKKRLIIAGFKEEQLVVSDDIETIKENVLNDDVLYVYGILNFDYIPLFNTAFKEAEK